MVTSVLNEAYFLKYACVHVSDARSDARADPRATPVTQVIQKDV